MKSSPFWLAKHLPSSSPFLPQHTALAQCPLQPGATVMFTALKYSRAYCFLCTSNISETIFTKYRGNGWSSRTLLGASDLISQVCTAFISKIWAKTYMWCCSFCEEVRLFTVYPLRQFRWCSDELACHAIGLCCHTVYRWICEHAQQFYFWYIWIGNLSCGG